MNANELSVSRNDWIQSLLAHLAVGAFVVYYILQPNHGPRPPEKIKIEFRDVKVETKAPEIKVTAAPKPPEVKPAKRVFGLNNKTLTSEKSSGVEVKAGNTIAKELDNEIIDPKNAGALPVPVEEYLISQMPKLKSEFKIAYPSEAKAKNIEGPVVMDILIDAEGKVRTANLISGPGFGLNEAALKAIYSFQFSPALVDGKPVAVKIRYAYRFILN